MLSFKLKLRRGSHAQGATILSEVGVLTSALLIEPLVLRGSAGARAAGTATLRADGCGAGRATLFTFPLFDRAVAGAFLLAAIATRRSAARKSSTLSGGSLIW